MKYMNNDFKIHFLDANGYDLKSGKQLVYLISPDINAYVVGIYLAIQVGKRSPNPFCYYIYFDNRSGQITAYAIHKGMANIQNFSIFVEKTVRCYKNHHTVKCWKGDN